MNVKVVLYFLYQILIDFSQVRERLRVALERNTALEDELALTKDEVRSQFCWFQ